MRAERDALADNNYFYTKNPWVVSLYYSFQVSSFSLLPPPLFALFVLFLIFGTCVVSCRVVSCRVVRVASRTSTTCT